MWRRHHDQHPFEERQLVSEARIRSLEGGIGSSAVSEVERVASTLGVWIDLGIADSPEVRSLSLVLVGGDLRRVLDRIDPIRVRADAPGPEPRLKLTTFQHAALGISAEELAGMDVAGADLGSQLSPLRDQPVPDGVTDRTAELGDKLKAEPPAVLDANAVGAGFPAVGIKQARGTCQVVRQGDVRVMEGCQ